MLPLLLMMADVSAPAPLPQQWGRFSRAVWASRVRETVDVATGELGKNKPFAYRLRLTRQVPSHHGRARETQVQWADSASCPAIRPVMESMVHIAMPQPAPPGVPGEQTSIVLDGAVYTLNAPSSDEAGEMTISSSRGSALATWVDRSLDVLAPCWKAAP